MLAPSRAADAPIRIVALGDSLTAGFGLPGEATFPVRLEAALRAKGVAVEISNAGVSGDTSSGGLARLDWSVPEGTDAVIVELGANDMLRGLDPSMTRANLEGIIEKAEAAGVETILAGMLAPPNLGQDYKARFDAIYPGLAKAHNLLYMPFLLQDVAQKSDLNQADGLHPNGNGVAVIVRNLLPYVTQAMDHVGGAS